MAQVVVLLVSLDPAIVDTSELPEEDEQEVRDAVREQIDRNLAWLRRLGYEADFCGTAAEEAPAAALLSKMMRAKRYNCIAFGADIRMHERYTRLFERLLNLAQVTKPDTVIVFDIGWDDTVKAVRRWFPSSDSG